MTPIILCCYSDLHPQTLQALKDHAPTAVFRDTSEHAMAYPYAVEDHWTGDRDLIVIEQDIQIGPDTISSLVNCTGDWCLFGYSSPVNGQPYSASMGCTKYSAILQRVAKWQPVGCLTWKTLDEWLRGILYQRFRPHVHGQVQHNHEYGWKSEPGWVELSEDGTEYLLYGGSADNPELRGRMRVIA